MLRRVAPDVKLGANVRLLAFVNLYGCEIGADTSIGTFVEIQKGVRIGERCKIQSHTFICEGVIIEDEVFIGHNVNFINDRYPKATNPDGSRQSDRDWKLEHTVIRRRASIGTAAVILPGLEIGESAQIGAGAVVTDSVPAGATVVGNPARVIRRAMLADSR